MSDSIPAEDQVNAATETGADVDDDLPVLTQILRIGSGHMREALAAKNAASGSETYDDFDSGFGEVLMIEPLVIGTETRRVLEPYIPLTTPTVQPPIIQPILHDEEPAENALTRPFTDPIDEQAPSESVLVEASTPEPFDYDALAVRVRESVLDDLSSRIDTELDARMAEALRAELESALAGLQGKLREQLSDSMRDVVRRAVEEEVARQREPGSS